MKSSMSFAAVAMAIAVFVCLAPPAHTQSPIQRAKWISTENNGDKPTVETVIFEDRGKMRVGIAIYSFDENNKPTSKTDVPIRIISATNTTLRFVLPSTFTGTTDEEHQLLLEQPLRNDLAEVHGLLINLKTKTEMKLVFKRNSKSIEAAGKESGLQGLLPKSATHPMSPQGQ